MSHAHRSSALPIVSGSQGALAARGGPAVLFGLPALLWPGPTLAVLVIVYGAFALVYGAVAIFSGLGPTGGMRRWLLAEGVLGLLAGLVALFWPGLTAAVVLYVFAFWAAFSGFMRLAGPSC